jgi:uncharacterized protein YcbK (DUF882 family)
MKRKKRFSHKISDHFSQKDFVCRCGKCSNSIRISLGLVGGLEMLRVNSGKRVNIVKGYLCPESPEVANSMKKNLHSQGIAAEIRVEGLNVVQTFLAAEKVPEFKGIGINFTDKTIHVDTRKNVDRTCWVLELGKRVELTDDNRNQFLGV